MTDPRVKVVCQGICRGRGTAWEGASGGYRSDLELQATAILAALDAWRSSPEVMERRVEAGAGVLGAYSMPTHRAISRALVAADRAERGQE